MAYVSRFVRSKNKAKDSEDVINWRQWKQARDRAIASKDPVCAYCHGAIDLTQKHKNPDGTLNMYAFEVDHKIPLARGGQPYDIDNLQLLHVKCNRRKGSRLKSDYGDQLVNQLPLSNPW